jgi:hypothetical protein
MRMHSHFFEVRETVDFAGSRAAIGLQPLK